VVRFDIAFSAAIAHDVSQGLDGWRLLTAQDALLENGIHKTGDEKAMRVMDRFWNLFP